MTLAEIIDEVGVASGDRTVTLLNADETEYGAERMASYLESQGVPVQWGETTVPFPRDYVAVHDSDEVLGTSSVEELSEFVLFPAVEETASALWLYGDVPVPEAVSSLQDTVFAVDGGRKRLLVNLAHFIEARAWRAERGTVRAGFQRLSRLVDEPGTLAVYEELAATLLDVHVYGVDDLREPLERRFTVHARNTDELADTWFVVFDGKWDESLAAALVAQEREPETFSGFWTFDADLVARVDAHLAAAYP